MKRPSSISVSGVATPVALASTVEHGAVLVTGDPGFRAVEHLVKIARVQASGRSGDAVLSHEGGKEQLEEKVTEATGYRQAM